jgi:integrase
MEGLARVPEKHRGVLEFGMESGLRPGEIGAAKTKDIDVLNRRIMVQRTWSRGKLRETTKGNSKLWLPLSDRAWEIIAPLLKDKHPEAFIFLNSDTGKHYGVSLLNNIWRRHSGTDTVFYEAGRHSFCTQVIDSGAHPFQAQRLLRHARIKTTQRYYHNSTEALRDVVNARGKAAKGNEQETNEAKIIPFKVNE